MNSSIVTFTGRSVDPLNLDPETIDILDIAHALSLQCRFSGHTTRHYSVAEHSLEVMFAVADKYPTRHKMQFAALLHDASEAYLVDIPTPLKQSREFDCYRVVEGEAQKKIFLWAGLPIYLPQYIHLVDAKLCEAERRALLPGSAGQDWGLPDPGMIRIDTATKDPASVEREFLRMFRILKTKVEAERSAA